jgi:cation transport ATPase
VENLVSPITNKGIFSGTFGVLKLARATGRKIKLAPIRARANNAISIPIAAGVLYPLINTLLSLTIRQR